MEEASMHRANTDGTRAHKRVALCKGEFQAPFHGLGRNLKQQQYCCAPKATLCVRSKTIPSGTAAEAEGCALTGTDAAKPFKLKWPQSDDGP